MVKHTHQMLSRSSFKPKHGGAHPPFFLYPFYNREQFRATNGLLVLVVFPPNFFPVVPWEKKD